MLLSGDHCHCSADLSADNSSSLDTNITCLDISTSLSWTVPPSYQEEEQEEELLSTIHVADVAVTVGVEEGTAITADILSTPTVSLSSLYTEEPELAVDTLEGEMMDVNMTTDGDGSDMEDITYHEGSVVGLNEVDSTTPDLASSEVTEEEMDSSIVTPSLPGVTERDNSIVTPDLPEVTERDRGGEMFLETDITNTVETGDTSTTKTTFSEVDESTTDSLTVRLTTLKPGDDNNNNNNNNNVTSCHNNVCRNGGTCLTSIEGFQCHCR